jgi:glycosyltransferase involved in cell wall biosynthesis
MFFGRAERFQNREGYLNFHFTLETRYRPPGVSAMLRVRNEERKLASCLASIYDLFDEIVVVDNGSQDRTLDAALAFKARRDPAGKVRLYAYSFQVVKFGPEHLATPEDSVHSFVYYSNWCLSRCSRRYVCKWDADMLVRPDAKEALARLFREVQQDEACWSFWGQTVYRDPSGRCYLSKGERYEELRLFPNGVSPRFYKEEAYEYVDAQPPLPLYVLDGVAFYELKCTDEDEFGHWNVADFPTPRKQQEWKRFQMLKSGAVDVEAFEPLAGDLLATADIPGQDGNDPSQREPAA